MKRLVNKVKRVRDSNVSILIDQRLESFRNTRKNKEDVFLELCFCLMTANFKAERSWEIQKEIGLDFFHIHRDDLAKKLKEMGHRFWPQRAERIVLMREKFDDIHDQLNENELEVREFIVQNVKGLGMKESSHFLRNIGYSDLAIIDFHIIDLLVRENLIERPKTITKHIYLEIENVLRKLGKALDMGLDELDLYLWYIETGKVLK